MIVDNGDPGTSSTGYWKPSGGADPYGSGSIYSKEQGATYTFSADLSGTCDVHAWWTYYDNRCTNVAYEIYDGTNLLSTVWVDQRDTGLGGQWNLLGTFTFSGTARVVIVSGGGCSTCADAVRFATGTTQKADADGDAADTGTAPGAPGPRFVRGDATGDAVVDMNDAEALFAYILRGGPAPVSVEAADANEDGVVDVADVVAILRDYLGLGRADQLF
jgi:hypothetical protein